MKHEELAVEQIELRSQLGECASAQRDMECVWMAGGEHREPTW